MSERTGSCLCGAVTYTLTADPLVVRTCWCKDCQHLSANGVVNALLPTDAIILRGTLAEFISIAASGNSIKRRFCPQCGAHVFANSSARPQFTVVRVGTLSEPSSAKPTVNIWASSAPSWACMDPAMEKIDTQPAPPPAKA